MIQEAGETVNRSRDWLCHGLEKRIKWDSSAVSLIQANSHSGKFESETGIANTLIRGNESMGDKCPQVKRANSEGV